MKPTLGASRLLDRLSHKRHDAAFIAEKLAGGDARFLVLVAQKPVIDSTAARDSATLRWFDRHGIARMELETAEMLFLGVDRLNGAGHFAIAITEHRARTVPGALELLRPAVDLRSLATQGIMSDDEVSLAGKAKALAAWHENARCCGHCGGTTNVKDGGWKRKCWACGLEWFPRIDPVVIMLVHDGQRCVLAHEARFPERMYSTVAGYVEPGEDVEHAVWRETFEETGLEVSDVTFHSTQPWPFPHSLMIGCMALCAHAPLKLESRELVDARWFDAAEVRHMLNGTHPQGLWVPGRQAIAHMLIRSWLERVAT